MLVKHSARAAAHGWGQALITDRRIEAAQRHGTSYQWVALQPRELLSDRGSRTGGQASCMQHIERWHCSYSSNGGHQRCSRSMQASAGACSSTKLHSLEAFNADVRAQVSAIGRGECAVEMQQLNLHDRDDNDGVDVDVDDGDVHALKVDRCQPAGC